MDSNSRTLNERPPCIFCSAINTPTEFTGLVHMFNEKNVSFGVESKLRVEAICCFPQGEEYALEA